MTVYVDDGRAPFRGMRMSHMMADTDEELHAMADAIGLKRSWFQGDHYDLCRAKRARAIKLGAKEITSREMVIVRQKRRGLYRRTGEGLP